MFAVVVDVGAFLTVDNHAVTPMAVLDLEAEVRRSWQRIEDKVIAAALSRAIARAAAGAAVEGVATAVSKDKKEGALIGAILSFATKAALAAADTPDTRSWETLPARIAVARIAVPPGAHQVTLAARGRARTKRVVVREKGWQAATMFSLR